MIDKSPVGGDRKTRSRFIKCVVWDLDNTLWYGTLVENDQVELDAGITEIIKELDQRGILQSLASRNDYDLAMAKLRDWQLAEYFLYPQINWGAKSNSIEIIAQSLNIGIDTIAFIDDQAFERDEVSFFHPEVLCLDTIHLSSLLDMPALKPRFLTEDSRRRREMYLSTMRREEVEKIFLGSNEEFLASLKLSLEIHEACKEDLLRAEELTIRTNQLNTTGYTYSLEELDQFRISPDYKLLIAGLEDIYGSYGKIGLALLHCKSDIWNIRLLLMSCRVINRGVGTVLLNHIMQLAKDHQADLRAEFLPNGRNRMMYVTYKFAGFREIGRQGELQILQNKLEHIQPPPYYINLILKNASIAGQVVKSPEH